MGEEEVVAVLFLPRDQGGGVTHILFIGRVTVAVGELAVPYVHEMTDDIGATWRFAFAAAAAAAAGNLSHGQAERVRRLDRQLQHPGVLNIARPIAIGPMGDAAVPPGLAPTGFAHFPVRRVTAGGRSSSAGVRWREANRSRRNLSLISLIHHKVHQEPPRFTKGSVRDARSLRSPGIFVALGGAW